MALQLGAWAHPSMSNKQLPIVLMTALHVMGYLHLKHNLHLIFDPTYPIIDESHFPRHDWMEFYGDVHEAIPDNMPPPHGKEVEIRMMCNSDHSGNKLTWCSRTGILIFINMALINWISKWQAMIETSVFGAEFVAMKHGIERLRGLWYKLRMMGVPLPGCSYIYADNKLQVTNSTELASVLRKKCNSICYHAVHESVAMGESIITHIKSGTNLADLMTKVLTGAKCRKLVHNILYDIFDDYPIWSEQ